MKQYLKAKCEIHKALVEVTFLMMYCVNDIMIGDWRMENIEQGILNFEVRSQP